MYPVGLRCARKRAEAQRTAVYLTSIRQRIFPTLPLSILEFVSVSLSLPRLSQREGDRA
jgi:hypothetical protein